jgi:hypothetical protein
MATASYAPQFQVRIHLVISRPDVLSKSPLGRHAYLTDNFVPALKQVNDQWAQTGVQMLFNPDQDVEYDPAPEKVEGDGLQAIAQWYQGKVLILHRAHGGNAGSRAGFFHLQDIEGFNMAHELGHYFNLSQTFLEGCKLSDLPELIKEGIEGDPKGKDILRRNWANHSAAGPRCRVGEPRTWHRG